MYYIYLYYKDVWVLVFEDVVAYYYIVKFTFLAY